MNKTNTLHVKQGASTREDFPLIPSKTALLMIDIQDHLSSTTEASKDGSPSRYLFDAALPNVMRNISMLLKRVRFLRDEEKLDELPGCEVIITFLQAKTTDCRDISLDYKLSGPTLAKLPHITKKATFKSLPKDLRPNTSGRGDIILPKTSCSVFQSTNLRYILDNLGIRQLVVCGQLTDQCVMSAVRDAADFGYFVTVVEDGCAALSREEHERGILGMKGFARIMSTEDILEELKNAQKNSDQFGAKKEPIIECKHDDSYDGHHAKSLTQASSWRPCHNYLHQGTTDALLHTLKAANITFLRFGFVDISNSIRTKMVPLKRLVDLPSRFDQVSIAKVSVALPSFADVIIKETNLDAKDVLMIKPDFSSLKILPYVMGSAMVFGTLHDQRTGELSDLCPRGLLVRVLEHASIKFGIGFAVGVEIECCLVPYSGVKQTLSGVDTSHYGGTTTLNDQDEFICDLHTFLEKQDINVEMIHSESAPGQIEIVLSYGYDVLKLCDNVVLAKETIKACAKKHKMRALFSPKVYGDEAGNGMHMHLSLRDKMSSYPFTNIFPGQGPFSISAIGQSFIEGILTHLIGLLGLTLPTPQSFVRVGVGCWTGHSIGWGVEDKESPLRVCLDSGSQMATNVEYKLIDSSCNLYLALSAVLWAGLNGITKTMKLRPMINVETDSHPLPSTLDECLDHLEKSDLFERLFGEKLLQCYVAVKRAEINHDADSNMKTKDYVMRELTI